MSIDYEPGQRRYRVRWREDGSQRSRRFLDRSAAEAFAAALQPAPEPPPADPDGSGVYAYATTAGRRCRVEYEAGGWLDLPRVLRAGEVTRDDVFLDLGSGKGRVVLQDTQYRFARVIGVEISEDLTVIARRNAASCRLRARCGAVDLVHSDALDYTIPDDVSVVYLFNPFRGATFAGVLSRLVESVDRRPRTLRVIYRNAVHHDDLMGRGFQLERAAPGLRPSRAWRSAPRSGCMCGSRTGAEARRPFVTVGAVDRQHRDPSTAPGAGARP